MRHMTTAQMLAFTDQLGKEAGAWNYLGRLGGRAIAGIAGKSGQYGGRMMYGTGLGAISGATVDEENRLRGAVLGGALGAGAAGGSILATPEGRKAAKEGLGKFVKRQKYTLTGKGVKDLDEAKKLGLVPTVPEKGAVEPRWIDRMRSRLSGRRQDAGEDWRLKEKAHARLQRKAQLEEDAFNKGLMSVPGVLKSPGQALKSGWQRSGPMGKAFVGLGAYQAGSGFLKKPEEGGPGRLESGLRGLGSAAGMLVAPPSAIGSMAVMEGAGQAGKWLGRGGDVALSKLRGAQPNWSPGSPATVDVRGVPINLHRPLLGD